MISINYKGYRRRRRSSKRRNDINSCSSLSITYRKNDDMIWLTTAQDDRKRNYMESCFVNSRHSNPLRVTIKSNTSTSVKQTTHITNGQIKRDTIKTSNEVHENDTLHLLFRIIEKWSSCRTDKYQQSLHKDDPATLFMKSEAVPLHPKR